MDQQTVQNVFDVPEKQRDKYVVQEEYELPDYLDFADIAEYGEAQLRPEELSIGYMDAVLFPISTSKGIMFYDPIYLKPLADKVGKIEMYERQSQDGTLYFAAKAGTFLEALILPADVNEEKLLDKLLDLIAQLELRHSSGAQDPVPGTDSETGEVLE